MTLDEIELHHGYTGHEMLYRSGLIHMDGRMYDPAIGRFLSPDNYVQLPENSQSFNRYSYCINNPLKYTDPTGQFFHIGFISASLLAADAFANAMTTDSGSKFFISSAISIFSPAVSGAIGGIFGHSAGSFGNELLRAGAHGLASGVCSALQGNNFGAGFASGALASFAGSGAQWLGLGEYGVLGATTMFGGIGSAAFGGNFIDGAMTGLNIGLYNHTWKEGSVTYNNDNPNNIVGEIDEVVVKPSIWQRIKSYVMDGIGLASTAMTAYAAPIYRSNWFQDTYWTGKNGLQYSSALLKKQANGKYVRGYQGYKISHEMAAKATRIPRGIGQGLGYTNAMLNLYDVYKNPNISNMISLARSIGSAGNLGFALVDGYVTIELWNYNTFVKPRIEYNIEHGLPWDFGTGLDRPMSSGSMP